MMSTKETRKKDKMSVRDLNLSYGDFPALKNISIDIGEREVLSLIGPSGCGKSTFIRVLNRMNDLIEECRITGTVLLDDEDIYADSDATTLRTRVGMVFQKPNPFPMSIWENIAYGPKMQGIHDRKTLNEIVETSLVKAAIWDEAKGLWSTDEYDVQRLVDDELREYAKKIDGDVKISYMSDFSNNSWLQFRSYLSHVSDNSHQLDENLTFSNTEVKKENYVSKRLPYALQPGDHRAYDYLISVLYEPPERRKLEWAIGAIVAGDAKHIQKCIVLYGAAGAGNP